MFKITFDLKPIFVVAVLILPGLGGCSIGGQYGRPDLPEFSDDWPRWTSAYEFPTGVFGNFVTVGQAMNAVAAALDQNGYFDRTFFATKDGGVALITGRERIAEDGTPLPGDQRWSDEPESSQNLYDLSRNISKMYFRQSDHSRTLVFVIGNPVQPSSKIITEQEAENWRGLTGLPADVAAHPFGNARCTALIYEFKNGALLSRGIPASLQLQRNGILVSFRQVQ